MAFVVSLRLGMGVVEGCRQDVGVVGGLRMEVCPSKSFDLEVGVVEGCGQDVDVVEAWGLGMDGVDCYYVYSVQGI